MIDAMLNDDEDLPVVFVDEKEEMRVRVLQHDMGRQGAGYVIEMHTFSELREEWQLVARIGDFDLHTTIALLTDAAKELYRRRAIGGMHPPDKE